MLCSPGRTLSQTNPGEQDLSELGDSQFLKRVWYPAFRPAQDRPKKVAIRGRWQDYQDECERVEVERKSAWPSAKVA